MYNKRRPYQQEWFAKWFESPWYSTLYAHRHTEEAALAIRLMLNATQLEFGSKILDLCCGNGRHSLALAERGFEVVGIDYSKHLLEIAQKKLEQTSVKLFRQDMRHSYPVAPYDCICNMFTSFGYFDIENDNRTVLYRISEALKKGGYFFFDYLNAEYVRSTFTPFTETVLPHATIIQKRTITDTYVSKRIEIYTEHTSKPEIFEEKVRLYTSKQLISMIESYSMNIVQQYGNYNGVPFLLDSSPRCIIVAQKTAID